MRKVAGTVSVFLALSVAGCANQEREQASSIEQFLAEPTTITEGQTTTLSWVANGADKVTLSGVSATPASSVIVAPTRTTTYTLSATAADGRHTTRTVTVNVVRSLQIAALTVDPVTLGKAIPSGYIGLSHEWGQAQMLMGDPSVGPVNKIYRQLVENLSAYGDGPISIRVGGSSTDSTRRVDAQEVRPFAQLYDDLSASRPGVSFTLGINLAARDIALTTEQAREYFHNMPRGSIEALEVGNEPDLYVFLKHRNKA